MDVPPKQRFNSHHHRPAITGCEPSLPRGTAEPGLLSWFRRFRDQPESSVPSICHFPFSTLWAQCLCRDMQEGADLVVEEDSDDEATEEEIVEMALHLGLNDITSSSKLSEAQLWIVYRALEAPLPDGWQVGSWVVLQLKHAQRS